MSNEREGLRERVAIIAFELHRNGMLGGGATHFPEWSGLSDRVRTGWLNHPKTNEILSLLTQTQEPVAWAKVEGWPYEVSRDGEVRRQGSPSPLKPYTRGQYLGVQMWRQGERRQEYVHRLVAMAFVPNPEDKPEVNHKNGDRTDNRASNLEWSTRAENTLHSYQELGQANAVMDPELAEEIRGRYQGGESVADIAADLGMNHHTVGDVAYGRRWVASPVASAPAWTWANVNGWLAERGYEKRRLVGPTEDDLRASAPEEERERNVVPEPRWLTTELARRAWKDGYAEALIRLRATPTEGQTDG